jgi:phenylpyruvate tautomerase PptA (4-oxalocrotonate tautomerase family)
VPAITVQLWEEALNETTEQQLIDGLTEAMVSTFGESVRPFTTVMLVGVPQRRWATGGVVTNGFDDAPRMRGEIRAMLERVEATA